MNYRITLIGISILIITSSCLRKEYEPEIIRLEFRNGSLFCEGQHRVYRSLLSKEKNRIGIWKFYHPSGQLSSIGEYDKKGEIINRKNYNWDGQLINTELYNEESWIVTDYYLTGQVESETITTFRDDGDEIYYYDKFTKYFENGQIYSQKHYIDNVPNGKAKIWNEDGDLILEYDYENGLVVQKDELSNAQTKWLPYKR